MSYNGAILDPFVCAKVGMFVLCTFGKLRNARLSNALGLGKDGKGCVRVPCKCTASTLVDDPPSGAENLILHAPDASLTLTPGDGR